ncbi:MAG TPA: PEGA domain-containing protein, partial [Fibrobacteria bacterium]|nr:PEGA domain-containing protein [Fibrobacteria bacterium]
MPNGEGSPPESARLQEASPRLPPVLPEPERVALTLESSPPFAEVYLEGEFLGVTPLIHLSLPAGEHRFSLYHKGQQTDTVLSLSPGKQTLRMVLPQGSAA